MRREVTLTIRNAFVYEFRTFQTAVLALISATLFFRTRLQRDLDDAALYQGFTFFALLVMLFNGLSEMTFTVRFPDLPHVARPPADDPLQQAPCPLI